MARIADTWRMDNETTTPVHVQAVLVTAAQMQFDAVLHPRDFGSREPVDSTFEDQFVTRLMVHVSDGRRKRWRTGFRFVIAPDPNIGRRAGLSVLIARHAHVLARVGAGQIAHF